MNNTYGHHGGCNGDSVMKDATYNLPSHNPEISDPKPTILVDVALPIHHVVRTHHIGKDALDHEGRYELLRQWWLVE